ncbi:hypothetical protein [Chromobacterium haemolyticum]|uniref:hypothetical protein n=1 Tax=Chromobacterium haemolyticum TaxID=394935 RepID=UPI001374CD15|nr:hypothetical protein [Chromobacterium haemolyticum]
MAICTNWLGIIAAHPFPWQIEYIVEPMEKSPSVTGVLQTKYRITQANKKRSFFMKRITMTTSLDLAILQTVRRAGGPEVVAGWIGKTEGHVRACCNSKGDRSFTVDDLEMIFDHSGDLEILIQMAACRGLNISADEASSGDSTDTLLLKKLIADRLSGRVKPSDEQKLLRDIVGHDDAINVLTDMVGALSDWLKALNDQRQRALQYR